jgi:adenylate cyclase
LASDRVERRLTAILAADVAGYSRLMGADEEGTLAQLKACRRELVDPKIAEHRGRIVKTTGDGMLVEFASVVDALRCAVDVQRGMVARNAEVPAERRLEFRVGVNVGDIMIDGGDIFGDGVNVAARLEGMAEPGGICVSRRAREDAEGKLDIAFEDAGEQQLKNIAKPIRVYRVRLDAATSKVRPALALPDKPSLAVLPFQNMSGDPEQEYFADGMVEEVITALSRVRSFFVIARNSSFTYKGKTVDVKQVGRELGVRYVLEGSVRKAAGRVRITSQLIEADSGHHVWADRFEGSLEDIFDLQDRVTESVVGAIVPSLQLAEIERARLKPTENLVAYDLYLRSLPHFWTKTREGNDESLKLLRAAISIEPSYSLAKAMAATCHAFRCAQYWASPSDRAEGARFAREAMTDHRDDPMTLRWAAASLAYISHEYELARTAIDRALALNPNSAAVLFANGWIRLYLGELAAAIDSLTKALRLSPLDPEKGLILSGLSMAYMREGRLEEGLAAGLNGIREMPGWTSNYQTVIRCLVELGRLDEAQEMGKRLLGISPGFTIAKYVSTLATPGEENKRSSVHALRIAGIPE